MDKQKHLYKVKHQNDPGAGSSLEATNMGIKGTMVGAIAGFIYNAYRPYDFLISFMDQYFEIYIVVCAVIGYMLGWLTFTIFHTES